MNSGTGDATRCAAASLRAKGLPANVVFRLKSDWAAEYGIWMKRDLSKCHYVYRVAAGRRRRAMPADRHWRHAGGQERTGHDRSLRESKESWADGLRDLAARAA
jgi:hypothetical protein